MAESYFENPRAVLKRHGLAAKKSWGQNFLVSQKAVREIATACVPEPNTLVVEIGAGLGTLTGAILHYGGQVIAVEQDPDMCGVLHEEFGDVPAFTLAHADAAVFDYAAALKDRRGVIAGNLPYQITGAILKKVMDATSLFQKAVFMVQEEVADRICASTSDRARGALTVMVDARCKAKTILRLKPTAFHPAPKVRSAVISLVPRETPLIGTEEQKNLDRLVKGAFANRRKTVRNSLLNSGLCNGDQVDELLQAANVPPVTRAEKIETETFIALTQQADRMGLFSS